MDSAEHRDEQKRQAELVKQREKEREHRAKVEAERKRLETARRKAAVEAKAKAKAEAAAEKARAAAAKAEAKAAAAQAKGPVPHPKHPNVLVMPSGGCKPAPGYVWRTKTAGDFRVIPKPAPKPAPKPSAPRPSGNKRVRSVKHCNIPCEDPACGRPIRGKLYFWAGKKFPDGWDRGWFCSLGCLNNCEGAEFWGMPHKDFKAGDLVATLPDRHNCYTLSTPRYDQQEVPNHTKMRVVSDQYIARGQMFGTDAGEFEDYYAVTVRYDGYDWPHEWVGAFYLVKRG